MFATKKCSAFTHRLDVCGITFERHNGAGHEFQERWQWKIHIPSGSTTHCGRLEVYEILPSASPKRVVQAASVNQLCRTCLKDWLFWQQRNSILRGVYLR